MFKSLKNALGLGQPPHQQSQPASASPASLGADSAGKQTHDEVSEWATLQGLNYSERGGSGYAMEGKICGKPWKMEQGRPSRDFIHGSELRARCEMGLLEDVAVLIMTRKLKNDLEKRAFSLYTDTLQTQADPHLPEEMRWLAMYEEVGWPELGQAFFDQYAILADQRERAMAWLNPAMTDQLLAWPAGLQETPRVLMVLRGKVYLRMQFEGGDMAALERATRTFESACEAAGLAFSK